MCSRFNFGGNFRLTYLLVSFVALVVGAKARASGAAQANAPAYQTAQAAIASYGNTFRIDPGFATRFESSGDWMTISAVAASSDGGFFVGGDFSTIGGQLHLGIAKYKTDGSVDPNFNISGGFDGAVYCIAVQQDGRVLVAGAFTSFNGTARAGFARLNADGTLDASFNPDSAFASPREIVVQADGHILVIPRGYSTVAVPAIPNVVSAAADIVGATPSLVSNPDKGIARLNTDGTVDSTFSLPGTGFDDSASCVAVQTDGRILVGGWFTTFNGVPRDGIARLNSDGSLDTSFSSAAGISSVVSIAVKSDGKIIACVYSSPSSGIASIVGLNANGAIDPSFTAPPTFAFSPREFALQSDGKIVVGGSFNNFADAAPPNTVRLNADGSLDPTYVPASVGYLNVRSLALQANGRIVAGGDNTFSNGTSAASLCRLTATGALDETLATGDSRRPAREIEAVSLTDGKILVHGDFKWVNGTPCGSFVRLKSDGALDETFSAGTGFDNTAFWLGGGFMDPVECVTVQADGKYLVGGYFTTFNGAACNYLVRLNTNGAVDSSFSPSTELDGGVYSIAIQADRRILAGGGMSGGIARLNADGSLDSTFRRNVGLVQIGGFLSLTVMSVQIAPTSGQILVGGSFSYNNPRTGTNASCIARLNTDGTIDPTFDAGTGFLFIDTYTYVKSLVLQSDGRILVSGNFSSFNGTQRSGLARLNANGSLDSSFVPDASVGSYDPTEAIQGDGRMVVGGAWSSAITRLNADGSVDSGFTALGYNGYAQSVCYTDDGRLLMSGGMALGGGVKQIGLVLLKSDVNSGSSSSSSSSSSGGASSSSSSSGGGGGAAGSWFLAALGSAVLVRFTRRIPEYPIDSGAPKF